MKKAAVALIAIFAVALAVVVGNRMSNEAMAVVVGVTCGVAASLPMSAVILWLTLRLRSARQEERDVERPSPGYPPVVVIQPGSGMQLGPGTYGAPWMPLQTPTVPRDFRIVGDETDD
jgi:hypothetical protein